MKKLLLVLLFVPFVCISQETDNSNKVNKKVTSWIDLYGETPKAYMMMAERAKSYEERINLYSKAGVDPIAVEDIQKIIAHLKNKNIGILITDHNVQETLAITDKTYLMFEGNIMKEGTPEELAKDEMVRKVYLGKNFELRKKKINL